MRAKNIFASGKVDMATVIQAFQSFIRVRFTELSNKFEVRYFFSRSNKSEDRAAQSGLTVNGRVLRKKNFWHF